MKEFILTQPYGGLEEMLNSAEVGIYKEELMQGNIEEYAIVSRIGNRYDINGNKIEGFVKNPYIVKNTQEILVEGEEVKYPEVEELIDKIVKEQVIGIEKAYNDKIKACNDKIEEQKNAYEQKFAYLKSQYEINLANAKAEAKAELLAKLNS